MVGEKLIFCCYWKINILDESLKIQIQMRAPCQEKKGGGGWGWIYTQFIAQINGLNEWIPEQFFFFSCDLRFKR